MAQSKVDSLFFKNELLKTKVKSLSDEMEKAQDHLKTLEREVNNQKAFSKLKDKQIDNAQLKIQKGDPEAMEKFKNSYEYSNKLCDYYMFIVFASTIFCFMFEHFDAIFSIASSLACDHVRMTIVFCLYFMHQ